MQPVILIATSYRTVADGSEEIALLTNYARSVVLTGGTPLLVPPVADGAAWRELVALGDAAMVVGGPDLNPQAYGQTQHPLTVLTHPLRQESDARLLTVADQMKMPALGICLGAQAMAVHRGGSLVQHLPEALPNGDRHLRPDVAKPRLRHEIRLDPASRLAAIVGPQPLSVNTSHHQGIATPGRHLRPVAWTDDELIEALEDDRPDRFFLGVQWHPEDLYEESRHLALFAALVQAAAEFRVRWNGAGRS